MLKTVETLLGRDTIFPDSVLFTKTNRQTNRQNNIPTDQQLNFKSFLGQLKQVVKLVVKGSVINGATPSILTTLQP